MLLAIAKLDPVACAEELVNASAVGEVLENKDENEGKENPPSRSVFSAMEST